MQNIYKYSKYFPRFKVSGDPTQHLVDSFTRLITDINKFPPEEEDELIVCKRWSIDGIQKYYNILYIYARALKVKLMWKEFLNDLDFEPRKGVLVIGKQTRVTLWLKGMSYFFWVKNEYRKFIKDTVKYTDIIINAILHNGRNYKSVRGFTSHLLDNQLDTLCKVIEELLVNDPRYELGLERYIMYNLNLDYKKYHTDHPEYYHAISKTFHKYRMLL